jgi:uncharacterized membrane protein YjjP (DUF1212 family)
MSSLPEGNPIYGPFFGVMGAASAIIFSGKYLSSYNIIFTSMAVYYIAWIIDNYLYLLASTQFYDTNENVKYNSYKCNESN